MTKKSGLIIFSCTIGVIIATSCGNGSSNELSTSNEVSEFNTVTIGNQVWMTENLNVEKFRNGDVIREVITKEEWRIMGEGKRPSWTYYQSNLKNGEKYGKLYNWYAVNDSRGICPEGYKIPSESDWASLSNYLGGNDVAGRKMKSTTDWKKWPYKGYPDGNGTNESGFSGFPGGIISEYGGVGGEVGYFSAWWSSTEINDYDAFGIYLKTYSDELVEVDSSKNKGMYCRCIKE
jgi:uncharacterized protein (TIGR02145 family)